MSFHQATVGTLAWQSVLSAVAAVLALPFTMAGRAPDPILAALDAARDARDDFSAAIEALRGAEHDKLRLRAADEAGERDSEARTALSRIRPQTRDGLHALIRFHAEDVCMLDPQSAGAVALREITAVLPEPARSEPSRRSPFIRFALTAGDAVAFTVMCGGGAVAATLAHLI